MPQLAGLLTAILPALGIRWHWGDTLRFSRWGLLLTTHLTQGMATRATFTSGTFQKLQGDPSTILKTITFHTSYKEVSNRSFVLKKKTKKLTSPKMFGLKHMNFEFPPTLDQKNAPPRSWSEGFPLRPWKKSGGRTVFCWWSPVGKLMICGVCFWDWDSKFGKLLKNAPCFSCILHHLLNWILLLLNKGMP